MLSAEKAPDTPSADRSLSGCKNWGLGLSLTVPVPVVCTASDPLGWGAGVRDDALAPSGPRLWSAGPPAGRLLSRCTGHHDLLCRSNDVVSKKKGAVERDRTRFGIDWRALPDCSLRVDVEMRL